ncbi:thiolase-like protein [Syncephalis plumigaleata]|nr:thiolase-like protein [Syncephalis plumigaleata]
MMRFPLLLLLLSLQYPLDSFLVILIVLATGLGVVCPLGVGVTHVWPRLLAVGPEAPAHLAGRFDGLPSTVAAVIPRGDKSEGKFNPTEWFDGKELRYYATFTQYALVAAQEALKDARWFEHLSEKEKERTGICIGSGMGGLEDIYESSCDFNKRGIRPYRHSLLHACVNMAAGPNHAVATACTTGAHAIASRPFDRDRDGFVIGEGAGVMVLEELEHARRRGDAYHMTAPPIDGSGAALAMKRAMTHAGLNPVDIDYVNAHATSTPIGDASIRTTLLDDETQHLRRQPLAVSSCKGSIGHLLGAAGAVESLFSVLAIHKNTLPPTANLHNPSATVSNGNSNDDIVLTSDEEPFNLDYIPLKGREWSSDTPLQHVLSNSFGFGGTNAHFAFQNIRWNKICL